MIFHTDENGSQTYENGCLKQYQIDWALTYQFKLQLAGFGINGCLTGEKKGTALPTYAELRKLLLE